MLALRILAVIALQTAVLGQMIYERAQILMNGAIVTLKTVPIDPRDLFRGYYVVLSYDINWLDVTKLEGDNRFVPREEVFVALEERDGFWSATAIYHRWPTTLGNQVVIGGQVQSVNERRVPCPEDESDCTYESQPLEAVTVEID